MSYVSNTLKLLELPDAITDGLMGEQITEGHARALSGIHNEQDMIECYKIILKESASVRRAEELARRYKELNNSESNPNSGRPIHQADEKMAEWLRGWKQYFARPVALKLVRSHRQTRLTLILKGTPEATQRDLDRIMAVAQSAEQEK